MPAKSKSQYRFFKWLESNPSEAKKRGVSPKIVKEFTQKMTKKKWKKLKELVKK